jgi:hypothetical protein
VDHERIEVSFLPLDTLLTRFHNTGGVFNKESKQHPVESHSLGGFLSCFGVSVGESNVQFSSSLDNSESKSYKTRLKSALMTENKSGE